MNEPLPANKVVFFWNGVFSQWADTPFDIDGVTYHTAEHYMMAEKARLFKDSKIEAEILRVVHK
jgi:ribA/ribD-fused uncharacterized protein